MLAGWFRMKYPDVIDGAIAASAPIWQLAETVQRDTLDMHAVAITRGFSTRLCMGFVHPRQSVFFIHISQRTAGDRWGPLGTAGDGWGRLGTAGDAGDRWGSSFVTAFTYGKFINWP